jgi:hypothetical protein
MKERNRRSLKIIEINKAKFVTTVRNKSLSSLKIRTEHVHVLRETCTSVLKQRNKTDLISLMRVFFFPAAMQASSKFSKEMSKINSGTTVYVSHCRAEPKAIAVLKEAKPQQQCNNVITRLEQQLHPSIGQTERQTVERYHVWNSGRS